ncbi:GATA zinc finger domain-containing protein 4 [Musca domestica]|uniref:GATA zinc finger domain-containing protein 4 n=1 Tax=Musca domestica TaxID=7370 RepID=T1PJV8_MUSDO|nr:GATA zinc finger domain-containing protein 4 [Musca domestica]
MSGKKVNSEAAEDDIGPKVSFLDWKMKKEKEAAANNPPDNTRNKAVRSKKLSAPPPPPPLIAGNMYNNNNPQMNMKRWNYSQNNSNMNMNFNNNFDFGNSGMNFNNNNNNFGNDSINFNGNNGYNRSMNFNGNNFGFNCLNNATNFNGNQFGNNFNSGNFNGGNNFNGQFNNGMNMNFSCNNSWDFLNSGNSFNAQGGFNRQNGNRPNGSDMPRNTNSSDSFFKTDTLFRQRDMIKETIQMNPFRYNPRAKRLLDELQRAVTAPATGKNKPKAAKKEIDVKKSTAFTEDSDIKTEPEVYVRNPRYEPNKPYIPLPKPPDVNASSPSERKQMWKEYNQAVKPYKNREFYNAKRVVQRLGKKDPSELEEKDRLRLEAAREKMAAYKKKLEEKYGQNHTKSTILNTSAPNETASHVPYANYGNFGNIGDAPVESKSKIETNNTWGRKILGGGTKYPYFVSGGVMTSVASTNDRVST